MLARQQAAAGAAPVHDGGRAGQGLQLPRVQQQEVLICVVDARAPQADAAALRGGKPARWIQRFDRVLVQFQRPPALGVQGGFRHVSSKLRRPQERHGGAGVGRRWAGEAGSRARLTHTRLVLQPSTPPHLYIRGGQLRKVIAPCIHPRWPRHLLPVLAGIHCGRQQQQTLQRDNTASEGGGDGLLASADRCSCRTAPNTHARTRPAQAAPSSWHSHRLGPHSTATPCHAMSASATPLPRPLCAPAQGAAGAARRAAPATRRWRSPPGTAAAIPRDPRAAAHPPACTGAHWGPGSWGGLGQTMVSLAAAEASITRSPVLPDPVAAVRPLQPVGNTASWDQQLTLGPGCRCAYHVPSVHCRKFGEESPWPWYSIAK